MAFVDNDGAATLAPLSQERIVAALERDKIIYAYDSDNDLAAGRAHGGGADLAPVSMPLTK